jgi:hypothetical protein
MARAILRLFLRRLTQIMMALMTTRNSSLHRRILETAIRMMMDIPMEKRCLGVPIPWIKPVFLLVLNLQRILRQKIPLVLLYGLAF